MTEKSEIAVKITEVVNSIPPMPQSVAELRRLSGDPNVNYNQIVPVLQDDPAICADILKHANSALFGIGHTVDTISEAVRYFGVEHLIELVAVSYSDRIVKKAFGKIGTIDEYFKHSREVSIASSYIARVLHMSPHDKEVYSVIGLLHDIGRLIIFLVAGADESTSSLITTSWDQTNEFIDKEDEILGINHAALGKLILDKWEFPEIIQVGVERHHNPLIGDDLSYEGTVIFLANLIIIKELPDAVLVSALPPEIMQKMKLTGDAILESRRLYFEKMGE